MGYRIVIADDEAITRMDIKEILESEGHQVTAQASDGFDAIEMCRETKPDLVLLDIKMPMLDGLSAARVILEESLADCVMLLTAYSNPDFIDTAKKLGVMGYIVKPIEQKSLMPAIEVAVARSKEFLNLKRDIESQERKLEERKQVEKAKGLLMRKKNINETEAYQYIRTLSMSKRTSMGKIAELIIMSHENMPDI